MGASTPTATGQLQSTPFCELLVYALTESLSGSLVLETPDRTKHAVLFQAGVPVKARVSAEETRIGDVLSARGDVDAAARRAAAAGPEGDLFGARLVAQGAIDAAALERGLREQLLLQMAWLARLVGETRFAYYDNVDYLQSWGGERLQVDPLAAIWRAVEAGAPADRVRQVVQSVADKTLHLHSSSRVARFALASRERSVADVLRVRPQSVADLEKTGLADGGALHRLVYALVLTRHLDVGGNPLGVQPGRRLVVTTRSERAKRSPSRGSLRAAPSSAAQPAVARPAPPAVARPAPPAARAPAAPSAEPQAASKPRSSKRPKKSQQASLSEAEIEAKLASLEGADHYDVLGLPADAAMVQVASAFPALARRWHPDRLRPDQQHLRDPLTRIFARMTEANAVLSHAESRQHYDQSRAGATEADEEQEQIARVLRSAEAFQKAEILVRKRDLGGAEQLAKMAFDGDADQPEYGALYAYIRSRREDCSEEERRQLLITLKSALARQGQNVRIRYYYSCVLKVAGHHDKALRELRVVSQQDPSNLDAARELRLYDMRQRHSNPAAAGGGLFGRIFRR